MEVLGRKGLNGNYAKFRGYIERAKVRKTKLDGPKCKIKKVG